jgi:hypothetical protein
VAHTAKSRVANEFNMSSEFLMNNLQPINSSQCGREKKKHREVAAAVNTRGSLSSVEINPTGRMRVIFYSALFSLLCSD